MGMSTIPNQALHAVLHRMADAGEVVLPFGTTPLFSEPEVTEALWNAKSWNPPGQRHTRSESDPLASAKPAWSTLVARYGSQHLRDAILEASKSLRLVGRDAITLAYGARDRDDELNIRLRGDSTAAQDRERERLRARYNAVAAEIAAVATQAELDAIVEQIDTGTWADEPEGGE